MILTEFFPGKRSVGPKVSSQWKFWSQSPFFRQVLFSFLATLLQGTWHQNEWIHCEMRTKIHHLWQWAKILWVLHFSGHSKAIPKFRISTVTDRPTITSCEGSNAGQWCGSI
jgi:hypothetical protein